MRGPDASIHRQEKATKLGRTFQHDREQADGPGSELQKSKKTGLCFEEFLVNLLYMERVLDPAPHILLNHQGRKLITIDQDDALT